MALNVILISGKAVLNSSPFEDISPRVLDSDTLSSFCDNVCQYSPIPMLTKYIRRSSWEDSHSIQTLPLNWQRLSLVSEIKCVLLHISFIVVRPAYQGSSKQFDQACSSQLISLGFPLPSPPPFYIVLLG